MIEICRIKFGSHLYGTATEKSDTDYKCVVLPTWEQIALGRIPRVWNMNTGEKDKKNTAADVDIEIFSIYEFIKLALEGQTIAFDMLHAPLHMHQYAPSTVWIEIMAHRAKFYSRNIHAFIGYACGQASRYSIKGDRLNQCEEVLDFLSQLPLDAKLKDCDLTGFPTGEYIKFTPAKDIKKRHPDQPVFDTYMICDKQFQTTVTVEYAKNIVNAYVSNYGARARQAASDEGKDWKAISHAFRVCYEARELFTRGTITFPLENADFILDIKQGKISYTKLAPMLDDLIDEVKELKDKSLLPEKPDSEFWEKYLIKLAGAIYEQSH